MELTGEALIDAPRDEVWQGLMNTDLLRVSIPGCESVTDEGDGAYSAAVLAAVGPVRAKFKGKLFQQNMRPPEQYGLRFEGEGGVAGFARGEAVVTLETAGEDDEQTRLVYRADVAIGGRLAQIGGRLIDATAKKMAAQFFTRFEEGLKGTGAPQEETSPQAPMPVASGETPRGAMAAAYPQAAPAPVLGQFTLQMPAWAWAFTVVVLAGLAAWLGTR